MVYALAVPYHENYRKNSEWVAGYPNRPTKLPRCNKIDLPCQPRKSSDSPEGGIVRPERIKAIVSMTSIDVIDGWIGSPNRSKSLTSYVSVSGEELICLTTNVDHFRARARLTSPSIGNATPNRSPATGDHHISQTNSIRPAIQAYSSSQP